MNVSPSTAIAAGGRLPRPSTFSFGDDATIANVKAEIQRLYGPHAYVLGALYYNGSTPSDYQYGISETAKVGESALECANRGLIEELGLEFTGTPAHFMEFQKTVQRGSCLQDWHVFIVHASDVQAATIAACAPVVTVMNSLDYKGVLKSGMTHMRKSQVIVCGTPHELQTLVGSIRHKPVKPVTQAFYDPDVKGLAICRA